MFILSVHNMQINLTSICIFKESKIIEIVLVFEPTLKNQQKKTKIKRKVHSIQTSYSTWIEKYFHTPKDFLTLAGGHIQWSNSSSSWMSSPRISIFLSPISYLTDKLRINAYSFHSRWDKCKLYLLKEKKMAISTVVDF